MSKKMSLTSSRPSLAVVPENADDFIGSPEASSLPSQAAPKPEKKATPKVRTQRLTFDIPADLHKRMRRDCFDRDVSMTAELTALIESKWRGR